MPGLSLNPRTCLRSPSRNIAIFSLTSQLVYPIIRRIMFGNIVNDNQLFALVEHIGNTICPAVQAVEFIEDFPDGFDTDVLERGKRLSTGQRQLVTFARALIADPKILILDEATASVDAFTEAMIQDALETIMEGRTSIVIAHRLSTIKNADRIVMIEHGKIVEMGSHDELLKKKGEYANLYETYFKHQSLL